MPLSESVQYVSLTVSRFLTPSVLSVNIKGSSIIVPTLSDRLIYLLRCRIVTHRQRGCNGGIPCPLKFCTSGGEVTPARAIHCGHSLSSEATSQYSSYSVGEIIPCLTADITESDQASSTAVCDSVNAIVSDLYLRSRSAYRVTKDSIRSNGLPLSSRVFL